MLIITRHNNSDIPLSKVRSSIRDKTSDRCRMFLDTSASERASPFRKVCSEREDADGY